MSVYAGIIRATFGGAMGAGDNWTCGLSIKVGTLPEPIGSSAELTTFAGTLRAAWINRVWQGTSGILGSVASGTSYSVCKTYQYDPGGILQAQGQDNVTAVPGTNTTTVHPAYVAACATLQTAHFGRSYRGRMYLPVTGANVGSASLQFTSSVNQWTTALAAFLADVLGMTPTLAGAATPVAPIVYSSKLSFQSVITGVRIDSIPDTQHGRENKFVATTTGSHTVP